MNIVEWATPSLFYCHNSIFSLSLCHYNLCYTKDTVVNNMMYFQFDLVKSCSTEIINLHQHILSDAKLHCVYIYSKTGYNLNTEVECLVLSIVRDSKFVAVSCGLVSLTIRACVVVSGRRSRTVECGRVWRVRFISVGGAATAISVVSTQPGAACSTRPWPLLIQVQTQLL